MSSLDLNSTDTIAMSKVSITIYRIVETHAKELLHIVYAKEAHNLEYCSMLLFIC